MQKHLTAALLAGAAFTCGLASAAHAADWAGPYAGAALTYGNGDTSTSSVGTPAFQNGIGGAAAAANTLASSATGSYRTRMSGTLGGFQAGYNWQHGAYVYGIEADLQAGRVTGGTTKSGLYPVAGFPLNPLSGNLVQQDRIDSLLTLRARGGYAQGDWLFFGSAGLAYGEVDSHFSQSGSFAGAPTILFTNGPVKSATRRFGWALGGGVEYALNQKWTVRADYLYYDLGRSTVTYPIVAQVPGVGTFYSSASATASTHWFGSLVRVGVNYRF